MSKKILITAGLSAILATSSLNAKTGDVLDNDKLMELKRGSKLLQNPALKIKKGVDKDSVYFLKIEATGPRGTRPLTAFLDKKTGAVYFGGGFEKDGKQMTFPVDADIVKEGISFTVGKGKKEIYVVTDPQCPYCQKFEKAADGKLDDYTVHYIFMPLSFHKEAPAMVEFILSGKDDKEKKERMEMVMVKHDGSYKKTEAYKTYKSNLDQAQKLISELRTAQQAKDDNKVKEIQSKLQKINHRFSYSKNIEDKIQKSFKAAEELGARGTPSVFDAEFKQVSWPTLVQGIPKKEETAKKATPTKK